MYLTIYDKKKRTQLDSYIFFRIKYPLILQDLFHIDTTDKMALDGMLKSIVIARNVAEVALRMVRVHVIKH